MRLAFCSSISIFAITCASGSQGLSASPKESSLAFEQPTSTHSGVCSPLPATSGSIVHVTPAQASQLADIVGSAPPHSVILLADGVYRVTRGLIFRQPNVTIRSLSAQLGLANDPQRVIIDGLNGFSGMVRGAADTRVPELVGIVASDITIADLTLRNAKDHLIHVQAAGRDTRNVKIYNVRLIDPGEQAIKINPTRSDGPYTDQGEIACSYMELTDTGRAWVEPRFSDGCYTGGIDAHQSRGWRLVNNTIKGFWCERGLSEHAIHVWTGSRDTLIDGNQIINSARGIGLGLGRHDGSVWRNYSDGVCGGRHNLGHYRGLLRNNTILANDPRLAASQAGFDSGISFEEVCEGAILNNTVISTVGFRSSAIEWRFSTTSDALVINNLTNGPLIPRDGARGTLKTNLTDAWADWFRSVNGNGDLHLARPITSVVHRGTAIPDVTVDRDGNPRGDQPDIGAYEYRPR